MVDPSIRDIEMIQVIRSSPIAIAIGMFIGLFIVISVPGILDIGREQYEKLRPVISDWSVTSSDVVGDDVVLRGTMRKNRDCLLVPPVIARDLSGAPYLLESLTSWRSKDASDELQPWGPWLVRGGAGKKMKYVMVYMCGGNYPSVIEVGVYPK
jgi:hypothetical protein